MKKIKGGRPRRFYAEIEADNLDALPSTIGAALSMGGTVDVTIKRRASVYRMTVCQATEPPI